MANEVKLQEGHPVDENLRPIKVGGFPTAIETAKYGDGARINGDLEVTKSIKKVNTERIESDDDIVIDVTGGNVKLGTGSEEWLSLSKSGSTFQLNENGGASTDDYLRVRCGSNGASTITTHDSASDGADLSMSIDGDISLDSNTGNYIHKNNGTEFSIASSSYAGMILGYRCIGEDATPVTYTLTTSMVTIHADATVRFIAPPSGKIELNFQAHYYGGNGSTLTLGISDNATYSAISGPSAQYEKVCWDVSRFDDAIINQSWVFTGLTAGDTYNYWVGAKTSSTSGTPTIKYGGDSAGENVPLIIKVTALPRAVSDFAEFG